MKKDGRKKEMSRIYINAPITFLLNAIFMINFKLSLFQVEALTQNTNYKEKIKLTFSLLSQFLQTGRCAEEYDMTCLHCNSL